MTLPAISKHLKMLEKSGLLNRRVEGRVHHLSLNAGPMQSASEWLETYRIFWQASFDVLARLVEDDADSES
ncbi:MAG: transcriptional regulator [Anaerolineae bacterium]|nr:transcriptional regulator [Anaerolineae bacterium]MDQ7037564.1 transcriptional regulator [Anaerolineae bacterium]